MALTFDIPLKRSYISATNARCVLDCCLHTFWYSGDTWTVFLTQFKNKYNKERPRMTFSLFFLFWFFFKEFDLKIEKKKNILK